MYDRGEFDKAVQREMESRGFQEITAGERETLWGDGDSGSNLAMRVERELGGEDLLFVGGKSRPDEFYLFEDMIWHWGNEWGEAKLRVELESLAEKTIRYFENPGGDPPKPALTLSRSLDLVQAHRDKLEEIFSPQRIDGSLQELSGVRNRILNSMCIYVSQAAA